MQGKGGIMAQSAGASFDKETWQWSALVQLEFQVSTPFQTLLVILGVFSVVLAQFGGFYPGLVLCIGVCLELCSCPCLECWCLFGAPSFTALETWVSGFLHLNLVRLLLREVLNPFSRF
jgi:hypothetical protein